jgi:hypothetical protein
VDLRALQTFTGQNWLNDFAVNSGLMAAVQQEGVAFPVLVLEAWATVNLSLGHQNSLQRALDAGFRGLIFGAMHVKNSPKVEANHWALVCFDTREMNPSLDGIVCWTYDPFGKKSAYRHDIHDQISRATKTNVKIVNRPDYLNVTQMNGWDCGVLVVVAAYQACVCTSGVWDSLASAETRALVLHWIGRAMKRGGALIPEKVAIGLSKHGVDFGTGNEWKQAALRKSDIIVAGDIVDTEGLPLVAGPWNEDRFAFDNDKAVVEPLGEDSLVTGYPSETEEVSVDVSSGEGA